MHVLRKLIIDWSVRAIDQFNAVINRKPFETRLEGNLFVGENFHNRNERQGRGWKGVTDTPDYA